MSAWLSFLLLVHPLHSQNNYTKKQGTNGEDVWKSTSDFIPRQSESFGSIRIGDKMIMEFDFIWHGRISDSQDEYANFFRIGFNSTDYFDCNGEEFRYPSLWLTPKSIGNYMHLSVSNGDELDCQSSYQLLGAGNVTATKPKYHMKISIDKNILSVEVGDNNEFPKWDQSWHRTQIDEKYLGQEVPVWWMSNKVGIEDYKRGGATFSNIVITASKFARNTTAPTPMPTMEPTTEPTMEPSVEPTFTSTQQPIDSKEQGSQEIIALEYVLILLGGGIGLICCGIIFYWVCFRRKTKGSGTTKGMERVPKESIDSVQSKKSHKKSSVGGEPVIISRMSSPEVDWCRAPTPDPIRQQLTINQLMPSLPNSPQKGGKVAMEDGELEPSSLRAARSSLDAMYYDDQNVVNQEVGYQTKGQPMAGAHVEMERNEIERNEEQMVIYDDDDEDEDDEDDEDEVEKLEEENEGNDDVDDEYVSIPTLSEWLRDTVGLPQYYEVFRKNGYFDLEKMIELTVNDMETMGITKPWDRIKIRKYLDELEKEWYY